MLLNRRFPFVQFRPSRVGLRTSLIVVTVLSLLLSPAVALAQESPSSFWIPPYPPREIPVSPADAVAADTSESSPFPLIVDTDIGVDDAVALAWLLSVTEPANILGIVTVAGNTTVENATKNVFKVLQKAGKAVPVVMGAKKPLSQKLSSLGKLLHGHSGLWGTADPTSTNVLSTKARDFYCSNAKQDPRATIMALGPLTNIAEAIRHCREDMKGYQRIVILGGAKFGGNTTPVAEYNFWQDPEAAQIVLASGMKIDLVPLDTFSLLGFTEEELLGGQIEFVFDPDLGFPVPVFPSCVGMTSGIFAESDLEVFDFLAGPVCQYAQSQFLAQLHLPAAERSGYLPDLFAAIYTVRSALSAPNALVEVVDRPDSVRGQSIIGLNTGELVAMVTSDKELDALADSVTGGVFDPALQTQLIAILSSVKLNAYVVLTIDANMKADFIGVLEQAVATIESEFDGATQNILPEKLFLPSVGVD